MSQMNPPRTIPLAEPSAVPHPLDIMIRLLATTTDLFLATAPNTIAQTKAAAESASIELSIDLGCVVSDIDVSVKFYTDAIGFQFASRFTVDADTFHAGTRSASMPSNERDIRRALYAGQVDRWTRTSACHRAPTCQECPRHSSCSSPTTDAPAKPMITA